MDFRDFISRAMNGGGDPIRPSAGVQDLARRGCELMRKREAADMLRGVIKFLGGNPMFGPEDRAHFAPTIEHLRARWEHMRDEIEREAIDLEREDLSTF